MTRRGLIIDSHAHLYGAFDSSDFFEAAVNNLSGLAPQAYRVIVLTERATEDAFYSLKNKLLTGRYRVEPTLEETSVRIKLNTGGSLSVIAGKQVHSYEGLEILALGMTGPVPDRNPILETVKYIRSQQGIPVIPWSFGKWSGKRRKIITSLITDSHAETFLLGDIIGRAGVLSSDEIFRAAADKRFVVLHGTDPLPLTADQKIVGTFASYIESEFDPEHPTLSLRAALTKTIHPTGNKNSSLSSLFRQTMLRVAKVA